MDAGEVERQTELNRQRRLAAEAEYDRMTPVEKRARSDAFMEWWNQNPSPVMAAIRQADELLAKVYWAGPLPSAEECGVRFITCCGVVAGDGRIYRGVIYQDKGDEEYWGECFDFPEIYSPSYAYGTGRTVAAAMADLVEGIESIVGERDGG